MKVHEIPHGVNVVIETATKRVIIGRFDSTNGFTAVMHDCDIKDFDSAEAADTHIRETATYGVDVKHRDAEIDVAEVERVRLLGDIPKL